MNKVCLGMLLVALAVPVAVLADSNSVIFVNTGNDPIVVAYTVCADANTNKHLLGSTPCNGSVDLTQTVPNGEMVVPVGNDSNHYASVRHVTDVVTGETVYVSQGEPAYNGCNSVQVYNAYTLRFEPIPKSNHMTCEITSGNK